MDANSTLLTDGEAAGILRMPTARVNRLVKSGDLPYVALPDGELRFLEADLWDWIRGHRKGREAVS